MLVKICLPLLLLVALNVYPHNRAVEDGIRRARIAQGSGQHQAAAQELLAVYHREPWRKDLLEKAGQEEWQAGRLVEATKALELAQASGALSSDGSFLLGEIYLQQSRREQALLQWRGLLAQPDIDRKLRVQVYERLTQDHREHDELEAAVELLQSWRQWEPENGGVAFLLGLHLSVIEPAQALPLLLEAARLDPAYASAVQTLRRGINQAAAADDEAFGWLMIGRSLGSAGYWQLAEAAFERATAAAPEYAEAWAFLGEARWQRGGSAKNAIERAVALDPHSITVRALHAMYLRRNGAADQALALLLKVAQAEPQEPTWQVEIANIYLDLGDLIAAQDHFQQAVAIAPQVSLYWQHLARFSVQYQYHVSDLGLPAARLAVLLAPDDPAAQDVMGWALLTLADDTTAERFLQRAVEIQPTYSPALLHLAQLYIQRQDFTQAYGYLKRARTHAADEQVRIIADRLLKRFYNEGG